jgi:alginate O-acetyltransferase complex protein AlgJ
MTVFARMPSLLALSLFALQGIIGVLTLVQPFAAEMVPALFENWAPPLVGVRASPPAVVPSLQQVLDGSFQLAATAWVGDHLVQRPAIVRAYNEALWRGFGTSYMANRSLVRGLGGTLFEQSYILTYCGINLAPDVAGLPAFAHRLRAAEDWFEKRGRHLVYYLAPVKTNWFPDRIPANFPCPAEKRDQIHPSVLKAFNEAGVDYVDGPAVLEAQRGHVQVELFPRNGIHWNWLGAAIGADALLQKLRELGTLTLPALKYDVSIVDNETGFDRDLSDLLNLLSHPPGDPAPSVVVTPASPAGTLRLATVNDSFFEYLPITLLEAGRVFRSETVFGYMTLDQRRYENGAMVAINLAAPEIARTLLDADVVVLEEVESRVGGPYALRFLAMMEREMAREQAAAAVR